MLKVKEAVLDRIEQSFILFRDNFIPLFLSIFIYKLIAIVFVWTIFFYVLINTLWWSLVNLSSIIDWWVNPFTVLWDPWVVFLIAIWIFAILLYLILYIPFLLALIVSIKNAYNSEKIDLKKNLIFWFNNLFNSFKTYWYIFAYVYLIPAFIFIVWWLLLNLWFFLDNNSELKTIWWIIIAISLIVFIVFAIYRWFRSLFSVYSAAEKNRFTKENFDFSINITKDKLWRILGNMLIVWLIVSLLMWLVWNVINIFIPSSFDFSSINTENPNIENILWGYSILWWIIWSLFNNILNTISSVFSIVFWFLLYKRLELEYSNNVDSKIEDNVGDNINENNEL